MSSSTAVHIALSDTKADPEQIKLMAEECILVDENDVARGRASKVFCHIWSNIEAGVALHRAFSVCLFNSEGKLLLQQRSAAKITFPLMWTNTCCSHPLWMEGETEEKDHLGVKRAAIRKLDHELGISLGSIHVDDIHYLTRILYNHKSAGTKWGEHEVDHILFIQKDVSHTINPNEVASTRWVGPEELKAMFAEKDCPITPWFQMICNEFLFPWWDQLPTIIRARGLGAEQARAIHALSLRRDDSKAGATSDTAPPAVSTEVVAAALAAQPGSGAICTSPATSTSPCTKSTSTTICTATTNGCGTAPCASGACKT